MSHFLLDPSVRRRAGGTVLIGGSPLRLFRLTTAGARFTDAIAAGEPIDAEQARPLVDRLLDAGVIHPLPAPASGPFAPADVTVIVPAYCAQPEVLRRLVLRCHGVAAVVVVDDASPQPIDAVDGVQVVRRAVNGGPGVARMTGLERVATPVVAFVDTDVELAAGWLDPMLAHFSDDTVALVAPRVASTAGGSVLARYDAVHSPLDLGSQAARVRAGTRVSYVPSAAVVCRVDALREAGGFDPALRVGEDVDLVWRLDESGWRVRYEPAVVVHHAPRTRLHAWASQRFGYGSSAALLEVRHPGALAPVRVSGWSAAAWLALALGRPRTSLAIAGVTTALLAGKLRRVPDGPAEAVRLAGLGHLFAGRQLASGMTRAWWPFALAAGALSGKARRAVAVAAVAPPLLDWVRKRPPVDVARYIALRLLDDASYGAGLLAGAWKARSVGALRPDFTSWPKSRPLRSG